MNAHHLDKETVREVFVYLYRRWIQKGLGEVPMKLALSPEDGFLLSQTFALYFSTQRVDESTEVDLKSRVKVPILFIAPSLSASVVGVSDLTRPGAVGMPFDKVLSIVQGKLTWLDSHKERGLSLREAYETEECGGFSIWKGRSATRLLFHPDGRELHGYAVIKNKPGDFFSEDPEVVNKRARKLPVEYTNDLCTELKSEVMQTLTSSTTRAKYSYFTSRLREQATRCFLGRRLTLSHPFRSPAFYTPETGLTLVARVVKPCRTPPKSLDTTRTQGAHKPTNRIIDRSRR